MTKRHRLAVSLNTKTRDTKMLPGIRFLFATVVLSFSVLVFGLGAAALLRSAHEEFVGIPAWRAAQQSLMPASDANKPTLALLRVEPTPAPIAKAESQNDVSLNSAPTSESIAQDGKPSIEPKSASLDTQATEDAVVAEKPLAAGKAVAAEKTATEEIKKPDEVSKPRVRRTKRARNAKTIRHRTARARQPFQPQQAQQLFGGGASTAFPGFEAPAAATSGGTGRNRRAATNSPF